VPRVDEGGEHHRRGHRRERRIDSGHVPVDCETIPLEEDIVTNIPTPAPAGSAPELARGLLPPRLVPRLVAPTRPTADDAAADAAYYLGSPRFGIGGEFFRAAPKLKLVQLTSAGYDRVDLEAARKAGVPVANNGGANSVAVAEHAVMLMLAVLKKLVYHH